MYHYKVRVLNAKFDIDAWSPMTMQLAELDDEMNGCLTIFSGSTIDSIKKILHYDEFDPIVSKLQNVLLWKYDGFNHTRV